MVIRRIQADGTIEQVGNPTTSAGYRFVGSAAPSTAGWSINDLWLDTSTLTTTTQPTVRVWSGSSFLPTPSGGSTDASVLMSDDFTGTDNTGWNSSKWGQGRNASSGSGGGATLLSGVGVLQTSTTGPNSGAATVTRKALITSTADVNIALSFKFDSSTAYFDINVRHDTDPVDGNNCYSMRLASKQSTWLLTRQVSYNDGGTPLASKSATFTAGTWYRLRFQAIGTTIRARTWLASATEPSGWDVSVTDSTYTAPGKVGLCIRNGTANARVFVDDVIIRNA
ncbi:hypothetical protein JCM9957A_16920 [Kineosporia succinea]